nr:MAG TPA: hypothetical protein [Caudoviricetes sp.]
MNEWTVVSALVVLVGLFMTVGKPVITLNTSITHLQDAIDSLREDIKVLTGRTDNQEERIQDHETRISILEKHHEGEKLGGD